MRLTFVQLHSFAADWRRIGLADEDLRALERELLDRPEAGKLIPGTGGLRKVRFAPPSWRRGKSGSARVCYAFFTRVSAVYLFTIYTKQEMDNLSAADRKRYRTVLQKYRQWLDHYPGVLP